MCPYITYYIDSIFLSSTFIYFFFYYISNRLIYNHVWIDEKYVEDYQVLESNNEKHPRGLSKTKICIVVAIDSNKNMAMINNMCGWLKRYIWRFIGMEVENLQSYSNWFIYLQRCKERNTQIILCSSVTHNKKTPVLPYYCNQIMLCIIFSSYTYLVNI